MNTVLAIGFLLGGVLLLSVFVSTVTVFLYGPKTREPTTIVVERPSWRRYPGWWGQYGAGLPGWGGPKIPPSPSPHPKPPKPTPPPATSPPPT